MREERERRRVERREGEREEKVGKAAAAEETAEWTSVDEAIGMEVRGREVAGLIMGRKEEEEEEEEGRGRKELEMKWRGG